MTASIGRPSNPSIPPMRQLYEACSGKGWRNAMDISTALGCDPLGIADRLAYMAASGRLKRREDHGRRGCKWRYQAARDISYEAMELAVRGRQKEKFEQHVEATKGRLAEHRRPIASASLVVESRRVDGRQVKVTRWVPPAQSASDPPQLFGALAIGRYLPSESAIARGAEVVR